MLDGDGLGLARRDRGAAGRAGDVLRQRVDDRLSGDKIVSNDTVSIRTLLKQIF